MPRPTNTPTQYLPTEYWIRERSPITSVCLWARGQTHPRINRIWDKWSKTAELLAIRDSDGGWNKWRMINFPREKREQLSDVNTLWGIVWTVELVPLLFSKCASGSFSKRDKFLMELRESDFANTVWLKCVGWFFATWHSGFIEAERTTFIEICTYIHIIKWINLNLHLQVRDHHCTKSTYHIIFQFIIYIRYVDKSLFLKKLHLMVYLFTLKLYRLETARRKNSIWAYFRNVYVAYLKQQQSIHIIRQYTSPNRTKYNWFSLTIVETFTHYMPPN